MDRSRLARIALLAGGVVGLAMPAAAVGATWTPVSDPFPLTGGGVTAAASSGTVYVGWTRDGTTSFSDRFEYRALSTAGGALAPAAGVQSLFASGWDAAEDIDIVLGPAGPVAFATGDQRNAPVQTQYRTYAVPITATGAGSATTLSQTTRVGLAGAFAGAQPRAVLGDLACDVVGSGAPVALGTNGGSPGRCGIPGLAVDAAGAAHLTWTDDATLTTARIDLGTGALSAVEDLGARSATFGVSHEVPVACGTSCVMVYPAAGTLVPTLHVVGGASPDAAVSADKGIAPSVALAPDGSVFVAWTTTGGTLALAHGRIGQTGPWNALDLGTAGGTPGQAEVVPLGDDRAVVASRFTGGSENRVQATLASVPIVATAGGGSGGGTPPPPRPGAVRPKANLKGFPKAKVAGSGIGLVVSRGVLTRTALSSCGCVRVRVQSGGTARLSLTLAGRRLGSAKVRTLASKTIALTGAAGTLTTMRLRVPAGRIALGAVTLRLVTTAGGVRAPAGTARLTVRRR